MHDAIRVRVLQRRRKLHEDPLHLIGPQWTALPEPLRYRLSAHISHHVEHEPRGLAERVEGNDVLVRQPGSCPRFPPETLATLLTARDLRGKNLHRTKPVERALTREVNRTHSAAAEQPVQLVGRA
jgi:hypothetical protein